MGIMNWLKRVTSGAESHLFASEGPPVFAEGEEQFHGLNMKDAIDAHIRWKTRLQSQLEGQADERLEVSIVAADNHCALGKWIHTEGVRMFGALPEFEELRRIHAEFHLAAGEVLAECHCGAKERGLEMLHGRNFRYKSDKVQLALVKLYSKGKSQGTPE